MNKFIICICVSLLLASCGEVVDPVTEYEAIENGWGANHER